MLGFALLFSGAADGLGGCLLLILVLFSVGAVASVDTLAMFGGFAELLRARLGGGGGGGGGTLIISVGVFEGPLLLARAFVAGGCIEGSRL